MRDLGYGSLFDSDCSVASAPFVEKSILLLLKAFAPLSKKHQLALQVPYIL